MAKVKCQVCGAIFEEGEEKCPVCGVSKDNFIPADEAPADTEEKKMVKFLMELISQLEHQLKIWLGHM